MKLQSAKQKKPKKHWSLQLKVERLEHQLAGKRQELASIERINERIKAEYQVLSAVAKTIEFIHSQQDDVWDSFAPLGPEEQALLQQLQSSDYEPPHPASGNNSSEVKTVASEGGPLYAFKVLYTMPPFPGVGDMTLEAYMAQYAAMVRDLSLNLALHRAQQRLAAVGGSEQHDHVTSEVPDHSSTLQQLQASMARCYNMITTASLHHGRIDLINAAVITSCDNPALQLPEAPYQKQLSVVSLLGLTAQQRRSILGAAAVFQKLLASVQQDMQRISSSNPGSSSTGGSSRSTATAAACGGSSSGEQVQHAAASAAFDAAEHEAYRHQRCHEEQVVARMRTALQKDALIRALFISYTYSQLSWTQLADLHCLMHPFTPAPGVFIRAVGEHHAQQERAASSKAGP